MIGISLLFEGMDSRLGALIINDKKYPLHYCKLNINFYMDKDHILKDHGIPVFEWGRYGQCTWIEYKNWEFYFATLAGDKIVPFHKFFSNDDIIDIENLLDPNYATYNCKFYSFPIHKMEFHIQGKILRFKSPTNFITSSRRKIYELACPTSGIYYNCILYKSHFNYINYSFYQHDNHHIFMTIETIPGVYPLLLPALLYSRNDQILPRIEG